MKIISIIGGRQHLIKVYALHQDLLDVGLNHQIIDIGVYNQPFAKHSYKELRLPEPVKTFSCLPELDSLDEIKETSLLLKEAFKEVKPDIIFVYGDIAPSVSACYAAKSLGIHIAHIESGLRNNDLSDTEEINRLSIDHFSDVLFLTDTSSKKNLIREGVTPKAIFTVGNSIIHSLKKHLKYKSKTVLNEYNLIEDSFLLITFHRDENLNSEANLCVLINVIEELSKTTKIVFIQYPNTQKAFSKYGLQQHLNNITNLLVLNTLSYENYLGVLSACKFVITDSSGIQDEATYLGKPCIICRENTHRIGVLESPNNYLVGTSSKNILSKSRKLLKKHDFSKKYPSDWDLNFGKKVVSVITKKYRKA